MRIKFCKQCGGILRVQQIDDKKSYLFCDNCGSFELIKPANNQDVSFSEKIGKTEKGAGIKFAKDQPASYPHVCKKCGYDKAQALHLGIFYSDEDNLILFRCGKCGYIERAGRRAT